MKSYKTDLDGVIIFEPVKYEDNRGFFSEAFNFEQFRDAGLPASIEFVQDNHSLSRAAGTVRGLHYQAPPAAQNKLIRVTRGAIRDVVVDVRKGSPAYGKHVCVELSAENWRQVLVAAGFLHGFMTLTDDTEVVYKVDAYYSREHDGGVLWNDPDLGIDWGPEAAKAILSDKDARLPRFADFDSPFVYKG